MEMEMVDRESTDSGSLSGNLASESPPLRGSGEYADHGVFETGGRGGGAVPGLINMNVISVEHAAAATGTPNAEAVIRGGSGSSDISMGKKKRGRPRKYDADGNLNPAYKKLPSLVAPPKQVGFTLSTPLSYECSSGSKRGRGKHHPEPTSWPGPILASLGELFANTAGGDFTPHMITVHIGEDVAGTILTFAQKGHRGICVLSANGSVSNVTLRQPGSSGGLLTYEGRFEILTLTGSYMISDNSGMRSRCGGLSVSLASPDGRVIGGGVAGLLMAASPIQIVVGTFVPNGYKIQKPKHQTEPKSAPTCAPVTVASPISQAQRSQFLMGPQNLGRAENTLTANWIRAGRGSSQGPSPDINISIPFDEQ